MLSRIFSRNSLLRGMKVTARSLGNEEWFVKNEEGQCALMATGSPSCASATDVMLSSLASCVGAQLKVDLNERGHKVDRIVTDIEADMVPNPNRFNKMRIHINVCADDIDQNELRELEERVVHKESVIANTITGKPKISMRAFNKHNE